MALPENKPPSFNYKEITGHRKKVFTLAWSSNGKRLASGSADQTVKVWNVDTLTQSKTEKPEADLKGHTDIVTHVVWRPGHADQLVSTSMDKHVRIWDVRLAKQVAAIPAPGSSLFLTWSYDGNTIAVINKENIITFIDTRKHKILKSQRLTSEVNEILFGPTDNHLMLCTGSGSVEIMSYPSMESVWSLQGHSAQVYCLATNKDRKLLVTGGGDAIVNVWDLTNMACIAALPKTDAPVREISLSPDGNYVMIGGEDCNVEILDVKTGEQIYSVTLRATCDGVDWNPVYPVIAFSGDERENMGPICILTPQKT